MTRFMSLLLLAVGGLCCALAGPITFRDGVYNGFVVGIADDVPAAHCASILANLEVAISTASATLRSALDGRATIGETVILLPDSWPDTCVPPLPGLGPHSDAALPTVTSSKGEVSDIMIQRIDPAYEAMLYTQQTRGCGQQGDQVYVSSTLLEEPVSDLGRRLAREIAKYRYGVFDETGQEEDHVYPMCHRREQKNRLFLTSCSDLPLEGDHMACVSGTNHANLSELVQPSSRSSLLFAPSLPHVDRFCDASTHDALAPTKHNAMCGRRSVMEIINVHDDFQVTDKANSSGPPAPLPAPSFAYKRQTLTRYVLVVEDTKDMLIRDSWLFLRTAVRKWANLDLPLNSEVGLVLVNDSTTNRLVSLQAISSHAARGLVSSNLPYAPGDSHAPACMACGLREALDMMEERARLGGPASSVIILLGAGSDTQNDLIAAAKEAAELGVRVATINYPGVLRSGSLDAAAFVTTSPGFTVAEKGYNMASSLLGTYFRLTTAFTDITRYFYQGHVNNLPVEVHRRELNDLSSVTGTFVLEEGLGSPARFAVFTHNTENPLLKSVTLISPSQRSYTMRSENFISLKMLTIAANINETGTWQYKIERFRGNPQPHFVQVMVSPWSPLTPVLRARIYTSTGNGPLVLYAHVTYGASPVLGAAVEVTVTRPSLPGQPGQFSQLNQTNITSVQNEKFMLLDTGAGDPDLIHGDGVYSRYFSTLQGGAGLYTFHVTVTDNGNTAFTWKENRQGEHSPVEGYGACCGSSLRTPAVANLAPFQRILPPLTLALQDSATVLAHTSPISPPGRVGDLRVEVLGAGPKVRLTWTAPDVGGLIVDHYEVKYATKLRDLIEGFDTLASHWEHGTPFPLPAGADTSFTLDLSLETGLLDEPLFVAVRAFPEEDSDMGPGPVSNWVRVLVKTPPPPSTTSPTTGGSTGSELPPWDVDNEGEDGPAPRLTNGFDFGLDLIIPVGGGIVVLAICLGVYCYLCVVRRSNPRAVKINHTAHKNGVPCDMSPVGSVVIRPHAPLADPDDSPSFEQKKRLSMVDPMGSMGMHAQEVGHPASAPHSPHHLSPTHCMAPAPLGSPLGSSMGVGHTGSLQRPRTLSPYQSWTASQLLHEHERRHSPYGDEHALPAYQCQYQPYQHQQHQHAVDGVPPQYDQQYFSEPHSPPVPPLPHLQFEEEVMYGVQQQPHQQQQPQQQQTHGFLHSNRLLPFNPSLQGSLSSVSSGDRKKRNVTMV